MTTMPKPRKTEFHYGRWTSVASPYRLHVHADPSGPGWLLSRGVGAQPFAWGPPATASLGRALLASLQDDYWQRRRKSRPKK
jgi:hypothetical protein